MTITFDTHEYVKELTAAGFTEPQAEAQSHALTRIFENDVAGKQDIREVEFKIELVRKEIKELDAAMKRDIKELEAAMKRDNKELEAAMKRDNKELELQTELKIELVRKEIRELQLQMELKIELVRRDIKELDIKIEIVRRELEATTKRDIAEAKNEIIKWMAGMGVALIGVIAAIVKLL